MKKQLKDAILTTIEYSTVKYEKGRDTRLLRKQIYSVSTPKFVIKITLNEAYNFNEYHITVNNTDLFRDHICRTSDRLSKDECDALEIWDAAENKYIEQKKGMTKEEQTVLELMKSYIAQQRQNKTR